MSEIVPKCQSWRGHRFEPRYSITPPPVNAFAGLETSVLGARMTFEAFTTKTYEGEV